MVAAVPRGGRRGGGKNKPGRLYYSGMAVHSALTGRLAQRSRRRAVNSECSAISAEFGLVGGNQGEVHEIYSCRSCSPGCHQFVDGYRGVAGAASVASVVGLSAGLSSVMVVVVVDGGGDGVAVLCLRPAALSAYFQLHVEAR